jgi:hypothetical protein
MMLRAKRLVVWLGVIVFCSRGAAHGQSQPVTITPTDHGRALVNPQMGWTFHFYSNIITNYGSKLAPSDTLRDFPGLSVIYLRVPWSFLEPQEGRFDWSLLDTPAQRWIDEGKQIALRISCAESWMRYATPEWVQQAGAKGYDFTPGKGAHEGGVFWEPDYEDPVFLDKLDQFLYVLAQRYDGSPRVAFIDVGSYGVWGEGHTFHSSGRQYSDAVKKQHLDLHLKHFKKTQLALSDDYVGHDAKANHAPPTDYAFRRGITLRDDSIMVQPPPRSWYHANLAQQFWPELPVILEHEHFGSSQRKQAWSGDRLLQAIEEYHASYMSIHWWPREFLEANRSAIDRINLRIGYRIRLTKASWPRQIRIGEATRLQAEWANVGVAPCYPGGFVTWTLKDDQGGIVAVHVDDSWNVRELEPSQPAQPALVSRSSEFVVGRRYLDGPRSFSRNVSPGECDLFVSVGRRDGTPQIALPLDDDDGQRRYRLGSVELVAE